MRRHTPGKGGTPASARVPDTAAADWSPTTKRSCKHDAIIDSKKGRASAPMDLPDAPGGGRGLGTRLFPTQRGGV